MKKVLLTNTISTLLKIGLPLVLCAGLSPVYAAVVSTEASFLNPMFDPDRGDPADFGLGDGISNTNIDVSNVVSSTLTWGNPGTTGSQSSLTITGTYDPAAISLPAEGTEFTFGYATFVNGVTFGAEAIQVDVDLNAYECADADEACNSTNAGYADTHYNNADDTGVVEYKTITIENTANDDPYGLALSNADSFCMDLPTVGLTCAWVLETTDYLIDIGGNDYGQFALTGYLGSITISDILPLSVGTWVTRGNDPTQNIVARAKGIPEPSVISALGLGLLLMGLQQKRRKST